MSESNDAAQQTSGQADPLCGVRGWLKLFIVGNLYINPVIFVLFCIMAWIVFVILAEDYLGIIVVGVVGLIETVVGGFLVWQGIQIARELRDIAPGSVQEAKAWLKLSLGWVILSAPLSFMWGMDVEDLLPGAIKAVVPCLIGFAIWYSYFNVSNRVKATYPDWNKPRKSYEYFIAKRYLKSKRKDGFISLITYISIIGVAIGVAALIIVLSIMNGFESEVRSRIIGFGAHIELRKFHDEGMEDYYSILKQIEDLEHITGMSPYIHEKGLIFSPKNKRQEGVAVKGVDPETIGRVSDIERDVVYGIFDIGEIKTIGKKTYPGIVLGRYLADGLGVDLGDKVQILSPSGIKPVLGGMPQFFTYQVTGFFETGIYELDDLFAYISLDQARRLFEMRDLVSGLEIKLDDLDNADAVKKKIEARLGYPYAAITWFQMNKNLFSWMQIEKWWAFIILSLIIMVAAFNIVSTLIMIVLDKTKEIGVLKSMGATSSSIMKIFMFEGLLGGTVGTILGSVLGYGLCWAQLKFKLFSLPSDVFIINALPILMKGRDFFVISYAAVFICFVATLYPSYKASKLDPVEAIRYE